MSGGVAFQRMGEAASSYASGTEFYKKRAADWRNEALTRIFEHSLDARDSAEALMGVGASLMAAPGAVKTLKGVYRHYVRPDVEPAKNVAGEVTGEADQGLTGRGSAAWDQTKVRGAEQTGTELDAPERGVQWGPRQGEFVRPAETPTSMQDLDFTQQRGMNLGRAASKLGDKPPQMDPVERTPTELPTEMTKGRLFPQKEDVRSAVKSSIERRGAEDYGAGEARPGGFDTGYGQTPKEIPRSIEMPEGSDYISSQGFPRRQMPYETEAPGEGAMGPLEPRPQAAARAAAVEPEGQPQSLAEIRGDPFSSPEWKGQTGMQESVPAGGQEGETELGSKLMGKEPDLSTRFESGDPEVRSGQRVVGREVSQVAERAPQEVEQGVTRMWNPFRRTATVAGRDFQSGMMTEEGEATGAVRRLRPAEWIAKQPDVAEEGGADTGGLERGSVELENQPSRPSAPEPLADEPEASAPICGAEAEPEAPAPAAEPPVQAEPAGSGGAAELEDVHDMGPLEHTPTPAATQAEQGGELVQNGSRSLVVSNPAAAAEEGATSARSVLSNLGSRAASGLARGSAALAEGVGVDTAELGAAYATTMEALAPIAEVAAPVMVLATIGAGIGEFVESLIHHPLKPGAHMPTDPSRGAMVAPTQDSVAQELGGGNMAY